MVNRNQYDELIVRYLGNELNAEEQKIIVEWIEADENNKKHFEQLSRAWRLAAVKQTIESTDVNREWNVFKASVGLGKQELSVVDDEYAGRAVSVPKKKVVVYRIIKWAVAASIVVLVAFGWNRFFDKRGEEALTDGEQGSKEMPVAKVRLETNPSGEKKALQLADGSEIILWAKSEVSFDESFAGNKRVIFLKGKADFKVAKDSTRPFTVISGDISTTALGTTFRVDAFESAEHFMIRLYEGKVVVKQVSNTGSELGDGVYLFPGQELVYDNNTLAYNVRQFETNKSGSKEGESIAVTQGKIKDDPSIPRNEKGSWFMFNNESIENVFKQLEEMYNVDIDYSSKDVRRMYFIGKFSKTDSVESILNQIGKPNGFSVRKENNKYIIY